MHWSIHVDYSEPLKSGKCLKLFHVLFIDLVCSCLGRLPGWEGSTSAFLSVVFYLNQKCMSDTLTQQIFIAPSHIVNLLTGNSPSLTTRGSTEANTHLSSRLMRWEMGSTINSVILHPLRWAQLRYKFIIITHIFTIFGVFSTTHIWCLVFFYQVCFGIQFALIFLCNNKHSNTNGRKTHPEW